MLSADPRACGLHLDSQRSVNAKWLTSIPAAHSHAAAAAAADDDDDAGGDDGHDDEDDDDDDDNDGSPFTQFFFLFVACPGGCVQLSVYFRHCAKVIGVEELYNY